MKNSRHSVPLLMIILMNLVPLYGMFYLGWSIFSILYLYWLETLIISFFQALKMGFAEAKEPTLKPSPLNMKINHEGQSKIRASKAKLIFQYLTIRLFFFFFYLIFIVVFVGIVVSTKHQETMENLRKAFFMDRDYNIAILGFILSYGFGFTFNFLLSGEYKRTSPYDYNNILDARTLIMHIVIVIGGVSYGFLIEGKGYSEHSGSYIYLAVFILLKTLFDLFVYSSEGKKQVTTQTAT